MKSRRIRLYVLYALPALGLLGLLYTGFAPIRFQSPFSQLLPKLFILSYLILDYKAVFTKLNPGIKIVKAAEFQGVIEKIPVQRGWSRAGLILRASISLLLFAWAIKWLLSGPPLAAYGWIGIVLFFAAILAVGFISSLQKPPQQILFTEFGIHSYLWSYLYITWDQVESITEKPKWVTVRPVGKADHDINFDELANDEAKESLIKRFRSVAIQHNIPYSDLSQEYNPLV